MQEALDDLVKLLDLEAIEVNIFRGRSPDENRQRVFGGQVAGQALVAAARTVDDPGRMVHSLHAYFLRPGDPNVPILYEVDRIRDGKSFTTRRVVAIQHGKVIFNLQAKMLDALLCAAFLRDRKVDAGVLKHPFGIIRFRHCRCRAEQAGVKGDRGVKAINPDVDVKAFHAASFAAGVISEIEGAQPTSAAQGTPPQQFSVMNAISMFIAAKSAA
jgi:hypothetical protein